MSQKPWIASTNKVNSWQMLQISKLMKYITGINIFTYEIFMIILKFIILGEPIVHNTTWGKP